MREIQKFFELNDFSVYVCEWEKKYYRKGSFNFFFCKDLRKMLFNVCVGIVEQIHTAMHVGKITNSQAIGWVQLSLKKITACISYVGQLQQICSR